jgi:hypothetical protein
MLEQYLIVPSTCKIFFMCFTISLHNTFQLDPAILRCSRANTMSTYVKINKTYILRHYIEIKISGFSEIKLIYMTAVCDMRQYYSIRRRQLFWCIHIQLAFLFIPLMLIVQTNVPLDRYIHSQSTIIFLDTHPGYFNYLYKSKAGIHTALSSSADRNPLPRSTFDRGSLYSCYENVSCSGTVQLLCYFTWQKSL